MGRSSLFIICCLTILSCSKKHVPEKSATATTVTEPPVITSTEVPVKPTVTKRVPQPTKKDIIPNVITVNDAAAHKSIDGRLYYDLLGHRYWKNYKNGKYYLFNQSMYSNPAFRPR